jgi:Flp pilus assembly protein CpaB
MQATRKLLSTRQGTLGLAILAGLLAVAALLTFMSGYKRNLDKGAQPVTVLVAKGSLPKGSSGDVIAKKGLFQATGFKRDQVEDGAITDPASLRGLVAVKEIVPGQQLTTADFAKPTDPVLSKLGADERALSVPLDSSHGMIGDIEAGDHVDVYAGFQVQSEAASRPRAVLRTLLQDVLVLQAPAPPKQGALSQATQTQDVVLRVPEAKANELAFSIDNGKVWLALRPGAGAKSTPPSLVTLDRLLLGMPPIAVDKFLAKKRGLINQLYQGSF